MSLAAWSEPYSRSLCQEMTSARMKPFSMSEWIAPAAWPAAEPWGIIQARTSSLPTVKKEMTPRRRGRARKNRTELSSRRPNSARKTFFSSSIELGDLGLDLAAETRDGRSRGGRAEPLFGALEAGDIGLVAVYGVDQGLLAEEGEAPDELFFGRGEGQLADGAACLEPGAEAEQELLFLLALGILGLHQVLLQPFEPGRRLDEVGEDELFFHVLDIVLRPDYSPGVGDVRVGETADDVDEGVGLAERAQVDAVFDLAVRDPGEVDELVGHGDLLFFGIERRDPDPAGRRAGWHVRWLASRLPSS